MTVVLQLVAVGLLILLNGFFVAAEYSLVTARRTRLEERADEGSRTARSVVMIDEPRRTSSRRCRSGSR